MNTSSRTALVFCIVSLVLPSLAAPQDAAPAAGETHPVENSVVKVFARRSLPDCYRPWAAQSPQEITGSGVVIEGNRILTNAHVVIYAQQIQIQDNQAGEKISATVVAYAPGIDLAILKLDDESFFSSHAPLRRLTTLPDIKDAVMAYGYPTGGTGLSITKGIVSRIEFASYNYPTTGLRIQIDAAINPGNSGGPAMMGDQMIGLAYSTLSGTQNIGYIIPNEEIELFLEDLKDGRYDGKPMIFDSFQTLENPALRKYLGLGREVHGLVVSEPYSSEDSYPLKRWDVITKVGKVPIDDQGMIKVKDNIKVSFNYRIQKDVSEGAIALTSFETGRRWRSSCP
jgi:S1-C subfamily serine protease